jgi:tetratricopeptide (TPR) repeat protein
LWKFWNMRVQGTEGRRRLERALTADRRPTAFRARALNGATAMALGTGDLAAARLRAEEALALQRTLGDAWGIANCRYLLGNVAATERYWVTAQQLFEESVRVFEELGDEHYTLLATRALAWMCEELGDRERYRTLTENYLRGARATGNVRLEARALAALGGVAVEEGRAMDALSMLKEAYHIDRDVGEVREIADDLCRFGEALAAAGRTGTAVRLLSSSEALRRKIGAQAPSYITEMNARTLTTIHAHLDAAAFAEAWEQGQALTPDEAVALALGELD